MTFDLEEAKREKANINSGKDSRVLTECATCYACEEYCPNGNHPFYLIVERQEEKGILPAPAPITRQQILMMKPKGTITPAKVKAPVIDMCYFPMQSDRPADALQYRPEQRDRSASDIRAGGIARCVAASPNRPAPGQEIRR